MKPHRLALTHSLVLHYGLYKKMIVSHACPQPGRGGGQEDTQRARSVAGSRLSSRAGLGAALVGDSAQWCL